MNVGESMIVNGRRVDVTQTQPNMYGLPSVYRAWGVANTPDVYQFAKDQQELGEAHKATLKRVINGTPTDCTEWQLSAKAVNDFGKYVTVVDGKNTFIYSPQKPNSRLLINSILILPINSSQHCYLFSEVRRAYEIWNNDVYTSDFCKDQESVGNMIKGKYKNHVWFMNKAAIDEFSKHIGTRRGRARFIYRKKPEVEEKETVAEKKELLDLAKETLQKYEQLKSIIEELEQLKKTQDELKKKEGDLSNKLESLITSEKEAAAGLFS